ncbi:DUF2971 domain-containing protein [Veronia pacifica]|uniref:DUF2971 domain-containing protein n=1 Tax=Veronia pacifica TaxID=1080227 RepID=A0A1C3EIK7_9GAMM|nr:DUF2971 domain-containing protein [Veronia pacifica]ODA33058.1 hypothetical protein A8L45_11470 [Veronia pacifica]
MKIRNIILYIGPLPAFLYKYEPVEAFEKYFGKSLQFSLGRTFNDVFDGEIYPGFESDERRGLIDTVKKQFIYSTSKNCHSNLMWGLYSDKHRGFCVGYNPIELIRLTNTHWADSVTYSDTPLNANINESLSGRIISVEGKTIYEPMPIFLKIMFQKEKAWQHEEEFRLVLADTNDDEEDYKRIEEGIINAVDKIIFGYKSDEEKLIKNFMIKYHETNILFFKASPSKDQYDITSDIFLYLEDGKVKEKKDPLLVDFLNKFLIGRQSVDHKIDETYLCTRELGDVLIKQLKNGDFPEDMLPS